MRELRECRMGIEGIQRKGIKGMYNGIEGIQGEGIKGMWDRIQGDSKGGHPGNVRRASRGFQPKACTGIFVKCTLRESLGIPRECSECSVLIG